MGREGCEVGFAGEDFAHPADGVLDTALLPGSVRIAEEGRDREGVELVVACELGAVVEGDGLAHLAREGGEQLGDGFCDGGCGLAEVWTAKRTREARSWRARMACP